MTAHRWLRSVAALAVVAAVVAPAAPALADAQPIGQCTTSSGVILAVDFSKWGGPLLRSCGTTPTTGYQLLNQGGWRTTGTQHDGPAFICRIGYAGHRGGTQYPTPADEKCGLTPPASAYWSYWHADPGQNSWVYSQLGAMSYQPRPGSVDLWIFGATDIGGTQGRPRFSPDSVRAQNSRPISATTAPAPAAPTSAGPGGGNPPPVDNPGGGNPPPGGPPTGAVVTTAPTIAPSAPGTAPSGTTTPSSSGTADTPRIVDAAPTATATHTDTGSALPALITVGVLALLALAGGVVAARRRRT
ncbi:hypothetical protein V6V47_00415 [Micromonospora sp. CPCC 205539]|uniref:hypothetical protein n=1 Tax=Micromonospora sp. CPCC 205539 TaxID=3122408 RepID=UPI002FF1391F